MDLGRHAAELFRHDEWNIGVVDAPISAFLDPAFVPAVRWLPVERGTYLADPFATAGPGEILCEEWSAGRARGRLIRVDGNGRRHALEGFPASVHLSYPYSVGLDEEQFCIPESWEAEAVRLYRRVADDRWELVATLIEDFAGVDATVFQHDDRWWLACAHQHDEPERALYLFHAEHLSGPWRPHAANPVKRDAASARPAGTPFEHQGALYRPAQDCSQSYGGAVVINVIERLTPDEFRERAVVRLEPRRKWRWRAGWHTLSAAGAHTTLIDAKRVTFMPQAFAQVLRRKLRRW